MSETVLNKGKLTPTGKTLSEYFDGFDIPNYYEDLEEYCRCGYNGILFVLNNQVYRVEQEDYDNYDDIFEANACSDGSIDFLLKYYNGGCGFNEALEEATNKLGENNGQ